MQPDNDPNSANWSFNEESGDPQNEYVQTPTPTVKTEEISWTGSEFLDQQKNAMWYFGLFGFIAVVCAVIFFVSKDILSVVFVAVMGVLFAIIASRKPRQLQYTIDNSGIHIGQRSYVYGEFKSFSVQRDGAIGYLSLLPLKRLHPEVSIYYAPPDEERIFEALALRIPHEQRKETLVEKLSKKVRF